VSHRGIDFFVRRTCRTFYERPSQAAVSNATGLSRLEPARPADLPRIVAPVLALEEQHAVGVVRAADGAGVQRQSVPPSAVRAVEKVTGCERWRCPHVRKVDYRRDNEGHDAETVDESDMTIAIGMVCRDGIVVGADRDISLSTTTIERRKAHILVRNAVQIGLVGAGSYDLINRAKQDLELRLQDGQSAYEVRTAVEAVVRTIHEQVISQDANHHLDLLIGIKTDTELRLSKAEARHKSAPNFVWVEDYEPIGYGYELAHFTLSQLYDGVDRLSSERGVIVTAHALKIAKERVQSCGGRSDIIMLKRGFHAYEVPESDIAEHERSAQRMAEIMKPVMLALTDLDVRPDQLEDLIGKMNYELNQFRSNDFIQRQRERFKPLAIEIPAEGISIQGRAATHRIQPVRRDAEPEPSPGPPEDEAESRRRSTEPPER
jgi:20S proteasome alpha/beta subunit